MILEPFGFAVDVPIQLASFLGLLVWLRPQRLGWMIMVFLVIVLLYSISADTMRSGARYVAQASTGVAIGAILAGGVTRYRLLPVTIAAVGVSLLPVITYCMQNPDIITESVHAYPFTSSRTSAGFFLSIAAVCAFVHSFESRHHSLWWVMAALTICEIVVVEARAALYSTVFGIWVVILLYRRRVGRNFVGLAALFCVILMVLYALREGRMEEYEQRFAVRQSFESDSFTARVESWQNYIEASARNPFGIGFERSFGEFLSGRFSTMNARVAGAHSEFLKVLLELGWIPFIIFLGIIWAALAKALRLARQDGFLSWGALAFAVLLTALPQFLVNNEMQIPEVAIPFWTFVGFVRNFPTTTHQPVEIRRSMSIAR